MSHTLHGKCLCGEVTVTAACDHAEFDACHCPTCRKWGGGPLLVIDCKTDAVWSGERHIGVFESSEWAERGFCKHCGTHLFYRLKQGGFLALPLGLFDGVEHFTLQKEVFIDAKPEGYTFAGERKKLTGEELFALFNPS
ncbi:MAG: GFA family protein [Alphaproteobacteria bacterium]|nr:GFA family protein [Alphaproteobacteria bacterium]